MGKLDNVKRILKQDYDSKYEDLISKLSYVLNGFMEQVVSQFNGNIDFTNLSQEIIDFKVKVDSSGIPIGNSRIKVKSSKIIGIMSVNPKNSDGSVSYLTGGISISFLNVENNIVEIKQITGLQPNVVYKLTLILIN